MNANFDRYVCAIVSLRDWREISTHHGLDSPKNLLDSPKPRKATIETRSVPDNRPVISELVLIERCLLMEREEATRFPHHLIKAIPIIGDKNPRTLIFALVIYLFLFSLCSLPLLFIIFFFFRPCILSRIITFYAISTVV